MYNKQRSLSIKNIMMELLNEKYRDLALIAKENKKKYQSGTPFPNIHFDDFFNEYFLNEVLEEFPDLKRNSDLKFKNENEVKLASKGEYRFGEKTKLFMHFLNSQTFLDFVSELTGIEALIPDPYFEGAGCHQILPGGFLKVHADFNKNRFLGLDRRLNLLVYLNKEWEESYGGHFELWDEEMKKCEKKILPLFNRIAMFSTTSTSYHGHPTPLACPEDRSRKSLALYYYTNGRPEEEILTGMENHRTIFKARKGINEDNMVAKHEMKNSIKTVAKALTPPILISIVSKLKSQIIEICMEMYFHLIINNQSFQCLNINIQLI
eukprot:TRINITY_DN9135_c2_g1_i1.p1 TRINITY_DN9135_c2_g1~~TRINITY_DN9135_c2_g1_i1.p1  ORF type:complete len:322 (+),score=15.90 TRINITY_DN9135_c2_g1_i1:77-1042(+)